MCMLAQGYGNDLRPLYLYPVITFNEYIEAERILKEIKHDRKS